MSERFLPKQRIRKPALFRAIFKQGKWARGALLNLGAYQETKEDQTEPRLAIMVSRKVSKRATVRNLWKRRIREVFRRQQGQIKSGLALLFQCRERAEVPSYREIEKEIKALLVKTGSLK